MKMTIALHSKKCSHVKSAELFGAKLKFPWLAQDGCLPPSPPCQKILPLNKLSLFCADVTEFFSFPEDCWKFWASPKSGQYAFYSHTSSQRQMFLICFYKW